MADVVAILNGFGGQLLGYVLAGAAVYGGIRADIKHINKGVSEAKASAAAAHSRLDSCLIACRK